MNLFACILIGNMVLYKMFNSLRILKAFVLFFNTGVKVYDSQAYRNMEMIKERIGVTFDPRSMLLSLQIGISFVSATLACVMLERISAFSHYLRQLL